ncbi:MocR-like pyridoxine biosynthesis transcription factor PdxR [Paraglaciecola aestuariivivens]
MKLLYLHPSHEHQAKYLQLADAIRVAIQHGQFEPGDALPSVKSLSQDLNLNRHTVMKGFAELVAEGWVESWPRVGYKVVQFLPIEQSIKTNHCTTPSVNPHSYRLVRNLPAIPQVPNMPITFNFAGGQPDLSRFPFTEFKGCMSQALLRPNLEQMGYGQVAGTPALIEQVAKYLRHSRAISGREIVITNGSQEALYLVAQLLLQKGDKVAVENLGYPPALAAFSHTGAELLGIKQDEQGINPADLEAKIILGDIRLIYLTPLHQYPTTITLSVSRRMAIYQLATKYQIPIVEDDYDHEFHYRCQPLAPMAANDPAQLVIYLSSFSKVMFPGARIGIMALSASMAKAVIQYRLMLSHKTNVLMQEALAKWMENGGFARHLRRTTRINQQRRDHAVNVLSKYKQLDFAVPDGGMALWIKLKAKQSKPISAKQLAKLALEQGVYIQDQSQFVLSKQNHSDNHFRLGFAAMDEQKFAKGIHALMDLLQQLTD